MDDRKGYIFSAKLIAFRKLIKEYRLGLTMRDVYIISSFLCFDTFACKHKKLAQRLRRALPYSSPESDYEKALYWLYYNDDLIASNEEMKKKLAQELKTTECGDSA